MAPGEDTQAADGSHFHGWHGVHIEGGAFQQQNGAITASGGQGAAGVLADDFSAFSLDSVEVNATQPGASGLRLRNGSYGYVTGGTITAKGRGALLQGSANYLQIDRTTITADGVGVHFQGDETDYSNVLLTDAVMASQQSAAVLAEGGWHSLDLHGSTVQGDTLFQVKRGALRNPSDLYVNTEDSRLFGRVDVSNESTLNLQLRQNSEWTLRPSADGQTVSRLTFLNTYGNTSINFAPVRPNNDSGQGSYQTLVVGAGNHNGWRGVYNVTDGGFRGGNNFPPLCLDEVCPEPPPEFEGQLRIRMNTWLNAGGALANQYTDRLIVNGDVRGITLVDVVPVAGSPGAATGDSARDGISLVQVYGDAASDSFVLAGEYVAVGPYQYRLRAFDPDASDPDQRDANGESGKFWDYRLQNLASRSGFSSFGGRQDLVVVPQLPSYVAAPTAIFQARLFDADTWHRRLGDDRYGSTPASASQNKNRDFFLRTYGGKYTYRSQTGSSSYRADTRYNAVQAGANVIGSESRNTTWRAGLAGSHGTLSFQPRDIDGNRKTRMKAWSVSPTLTWQHAQGGYVDALVAWGGFNGDVSTRQRGKTATLSGQSLAASLEFGAPFYAGGLTLLPQVQAVYQHLKFDNTRDVDGLSVALGSQRQWLTRSGGEIRKSFEMAGDNAVQIYSKVHVAHTLNDSKKVQIGGQAFRTGQSGTVLEAGLGVDATFGKGRSVLYADVSRQCRISRAGHQGWTANIGARVHF